MQDFVKKDFNFFICEDAAQAESLQEGIDFASITDTDTFLDKDEVKGGWVFSKKKATRSDKSYSSVKSHFRHKPK